MDYRCPVCGANTGKRKFSHAIVARMEVDCSHCGSTIRLNVHRAEAIVVMLNFGTIIVLGVLAYWFQSQGLVLAVLAAAMAGALALPLLEQCWLRSWPRYAKIDRSPEA